MLLGCLLDPKTDDRQLGLAAFGFGQCLGQRRVGLLGDGPMTVCDPGLKVCGQLLECLGRVGRFPGHVLAERRQKLLLQLRELCVLLLAAFFEVLVETSFRPAGQQLGVLLHHAWPGGMGRRQCRDKLRAEVDRQLLRRRLGKGESLLNDCLNRFHGHFDGGGIRVAFDHRQGDVQGPGVRPFQSLELGLRQDLWSKGADLGGKLGPIGPGRLVRVLLVDGVVDRHHVGQGLGQLSPRHALRQPARPSFVFQLLDRDAHLATGLCPKHQQPARAGKRSRQECVGRLDGRRVGPLGPVPLVEVVQNLVG